MFIVPNNYPIRTQAAGLLVQKGYELEGLVRATLPGSAEQTLALRYLQMSIFYACLSANTSQQGYEEVDRGGVVPQSSYGPPVQGRMPSLPNPPLGGQQIPDAFLPDPTMYHRPYAPQGNNPNAPVANLKATAVHNVPGEVILPEPGDLNAN